VKRIPKPRPKIETSIQQPIYDRPYLDRRNELRNEKRAIQVLSLGRPLTPNDFRLRVAAPEQCWTASCPSCGRTVISAVGSCKGMLCGRCFYRKED
jgi:hypothetical protein